MNHPKYAQVSGPVVMIGFGSIGRGVLPLVLRHLDITPAQVTVVAPNDDGDHILKEYGVKRIDCALTAQNHREVLTPLLDSTSGTAFCINLSVDTSSVAILRLARELGALYVDTVIEPWAGLYDNPDLPLADRTNLALRETLLAERRARPGGKTAVSACGANPGMVSWFVKQALLDVADKVGLGGAVPSDRQEWARLMERVGVRGIHIAERDTQRPRQPRSLGTFVNTWSVEGFIAEGLQPSEIGWGTHEKWLPPSAQRHQDPLAATIFLDQPGAATRVRTWCPTAGPQHGLCVTHNEAVSISDYFSVVDGDSVRYRPTCHYAYQPCDEALASWHELLGSAGTLPERHHILDVDEIADGVDELGVLLYGHELNAYWYGSRLSNDEARKLAPHQNATGLQVTSAVLAAMVWAIENPDAGIVEADEVDFRRCLEIQRPYLGPVEGHFTNWTPLTGRSKLFHDDVDESDPWQFRNVLVR
ncbi:saccharopine dehydrogenase C-terminal domain-containing protein [Kitasatospora sp. MAP5-34]|uniref:homospermidine synthase n=1 Tax=Kitasatospora sp. MAP5-34 TaxID=3035102 RepID=UPI002474D6C3|nr:saccharopine dehydrogenase C-terminal domain-containing protein [Kitasatospora sp. MAP5-34]MDH6577385.1 homospermidine synthase [Kitasatospora sp. MAP5-34]